MAEVTATVLVDAEVKEKVQALYAELGLDLSAAVNLFFRQCLLEGDLPFAVTFPEAGYPGGVVAAMTDDEKTDFVARRILRVHKAAFEALAK